MFAPSPPRSTLFSFIVYLHKIRHMALEFSLSSSCLHPVFGPLFIPYSLSESGLQSKEVWSNLGMKCWNSAFNAQGSGVIIVVVQVGAMKIYVAAVDALKKNERQDETQFTTKIAGKTSLGPCYFAL
jgi:hypothetical protein